MIKNNLPTILGILFLLAAVAAGTLLVQYNQEYRTKASGDTSPKNVRISNITDSSFSVSWTTDKKTAGFIKYAEKNAIKKVKEDEIKEDSETHFVKIDQLKQETTYQFSIVSDSTEYDNGGGQWQTATALTTTKPPEPNIVSGVVKNEIGLPVENALVYVVFGNSTMLSTYTSGAGSWIINLSLLRDSNLLNLPNLTGASVIEISVQAGSAGVATAQVPVNLAKPTPDITLGQFHDFKSVKRVDIKDLPSAIIELPKVATPESSF